MWVAVVKAKLKSKQKRLGTKAVKAREILDSPGDQLSEELATAYRALAARANYLALDRPDPCFAAKELCREFAHPTSTSVKALKRLVRYPNLCPRLIWRYGWST